MKSLREIFHIGKKSPPAPPLSLRDFWNVTEISHDGLLRAGSKRGFMFEFEGLDGTFLSSSQLNALHNDWRSVLRMPAGDEIQIVLRKRVNFLRWVEDQLAQAFLADSSYGRRILLDRLADQVGQMSGNEPRLLSQKIIACYWTHESPDNESLAEKRKLVRAQLSAFGFGVGTLNRMEIEREINSSVQDLGASDGNEPEWPNLRIEASGLRINEDLFRAVELTTLPESSTVLGMIQSISGLPFPIDICLRLTSRDLKPIISRLGNKRNLLHAQRASRKAPMANIDSQIEQIDDALKRLADRSEGVFDMKLTVGLRLPKNLILFQRKAMANIIRAAAKMDFCEFEESTLSTFDSYLECIPGFSGKNIRSHTVMTSNAIHFLPLFRPSGGDPRAVATFQTRTGSLYGIDPVDSRLANYNWLVSGTSGAGKSFFVNSLIAQSASINPNIFIVDIGGSYNKLTRFLGGQVMSLEPGQGFELSPFFLPKSSDPTEERLRRQHIYQIFLEMTRIDGHLPSIEVRHLLSGILTDLFDRDRLPERPISYIIDKISHESSPEARQLSMLLQQWGKDGFFAQFIDNDKVVTHTDRILTFDLKGLTEFEDLSRVVQLIVCASLWARIRRTDNRKFSWIVLDEVAFSLLKSQPEFVDELVSTLRKHFAGAVIVVQDLEKITSNLAGSSILQNTQCKAILQQRGDPRNYSEALSLTQIDLWAIESLRREKGAYSDVFLIRDFEKAVIRHVPSALEYWLSTSAPEDVVEFKRWEKEAKGPYRDKVLEFVAHKSRKDGATPCSS